MMGKFRDGDRVIIKKPKDVTESPYWSEPEMDKFAGETVTVEQVDGNTFYIVEDDGEWQYGDQWAELATASAPETLTLRDQFAMAALGSLVREYPYDDPHLAVAAYVVADAMLAERERASK